MYSLHLRCLPSQVDQIAADLNGEGTLGIREIEEEQDTLLVAGFKGNERRSILLHLFKDHFPEWHTEADTDWVQYTKDQWQPREVGQLLFLLPYWSSAQVPPGRIALRHNPGLACGTGEHPCTQLALEAIEEYCSIGSRVLDVGTGSGILALAACGLGASLVIGIDHDQQSLPSARENLNLNGFAPPLIAGSVDSVSSAAFDLTVANISSSVLLSLLDDLIRVTTPEGWLILTGFTEEEAAFFAQAFRVASSTELDGWACVTVRPFSFVRSFASL